MVGVNAFTMDPGIQEALVNHPAWLDTPATVSPMSSESLIHAVDLVPVEVTSLLRLALDHHHWLAVGLDGVSGKPVDQIGNYRLSNWNEPLADLLWARIQAMLPGVRHMDAWTPTDHGGHGAWRPVGVSPLMRFIQYREGGQLVAHYDATYQESEDRRTLMSLVVYLTSNQGGATRFIRDPQAGTPMDRMDFRDWDRTAREDEVIYANKPRAGEALIFDHRLLHDGQPLAPGDNEKIIIRTDVMFERA